MEGEIDKLGKAWLTVLASLCYCYFIVSKIPKGTLRLLTLLPIFYLFTILPLHLTGVVSTGVTAFFFTWLANFKLLLFAFDQGPLSSDPPISFPLFLFLACFPIKIKENKKYPSHQKSKKSTNLTPNSPPKFKLNMPTKILAYAILLTFHDYYKDKVHPKVLIVIYFCMLYFFVDVLLGSCIALVKAVLDIELEMPSEEPYLSTSLQDFWGRRWNRVVSNTLRDTIYKPLRSALGNSTWSVMLALMSAFVVSGLMHELLYYYFLRVSPTWEVTWYFVLHGVCVMVELVVKKVVGGKVQLHWTISAVLTVGFVMSTAMWLFFPPLERNGAVLQSLEEYKAVIEFLKEKLRLR